MKEAYRLNKSLLVDGENKKKLIAFVYVSPELENYQKIQFKIQKVLKRLAGQRESNKKHDEEKK